MSFFWDKSRRVDWFVEANDSEIRAVSIFRAEVMAHHFNISAMKMETAGFSESLASTNQSTRRDLTQKNIIRNILVGFPGSNAVRTC
jgi:hypothetical protein